MSQIVDARGLACPQPVVLTAKAIAAAAEATVLVDNQVAAENVTRFAASRGFSVERSEGPEGICLHLRKSGTSAGESVPQQFIACQPAAPTGKLVLLVASDSLGRGPAELGGQLLDTFFYALREASPRPDTVIFMNSGAKLATVGSPVLDHLMELQQQGIEILVCGNCLKFFDLTEKLAVGRVSNMLEIVGRLLQAGKVIHT